MTRASKIARLFGVSFWIFACISISLTPIMAQEESITITAGNVGELRAVAQFGRGNVRDIALSPDDVTLAVATDQGVWVYDLTNSNDAGSALHQTRAAFTTVEFDAAGANLAAGTANGQVMVWGTTTWEERALLEVPDGASVSDLVFLGSPFRLAAGDSAHRLTAWRMEALDQQGVTIGGHSNPIAELATADNGEWLVSRDADEILFWESDGLLGSTDSISDFNQSIGAMAFRPGSGVHIALAVGLELIIDSDLGTQGGVVSLDTERAIDKLTFSADGSVLAAVEGSHVTLRDPYTGEVLNTLEASSSVQDAAFTGDGSYLFTAHSASISLWELSDGSLVGTRYDTFGVVNPLSVSPDGSLLAAGSASSPAINIYDLESLELVTIIEQGSDGRPGSLVFSPDGRYLAAASDGSDISVWLWDTETWEAVAQYEGHAEPLLSLVFSPDSTLIMGGSGDISQNDGDARTATIWNVETGEIVRQWVAHDGREVWSTLFTPDGTTILTGGGDNNLRLWDIDEEEPLETVSLPFTPYWMTINAAGTILFYSNTTTTNFLSLNPGGEFTPVPSYVSAAAGTSAFSPDGQLAAIKSGETPTNVEFYSVPDYTFAGSITAASDNVDAMVFTPDGTRLITTNGELIVWEVGG